MNFVLFASDFPGWAILLLILAIFLLIILGVMLLKKHTKLFKDDSKPKSEKEIAAEELNRLLTPIDEPLQEKKEGEDEDEKEK